MLRFYLKEEYRRHAYIAKKFSLFVFPIYVLASSLFAAYFYDYILTIFSYGNFIKLTLMSSLLYGFGISSFEFLGRRRERFSLVNTSSILPLSTRKSYFYVFLRDIVYYTSLFIIPLYAGLLLGTFISSLHPLQVSYFTFSLFLSMLLGYSLGYLSFSLNGISRKAYYALLLSLLIYVALFFLNILPFPLEIFQREKDLLSLSIGAAISSLLIPLAYFLTPAELSEVERVAKNALSSYEKLFKNVLLGKIMEDAIRGGVVYKSLLTYFFPMLLLFIFVRMVNMAMATELYNSLSLSLMLALFSVVIYSWLTVIDDFRYFQTLPLTAADIIHAFIKAHLIIVSLISVPILIAFNIHTPHLLAPSLLLFYLTSLYLLSMVANISGYRINSMLFNPGIVLRFTVYTLIPGTILLITSIEPTTHALFIAMITGTAMIFITFHNFRDIKRKWMYF